jgi:asparagine synthase (glutamine-hydrolysing)
VSALAGVWRSDGQSIERRDLERIAGAMPRFDGGRPAIWLSDEVGLLYRPFVVTPEDRLERQPWSDASGRHRLLFAGRLDNRADLARELDVPGPLLRDMADGRLCMAAFERWGLDAPARLVGTYAIAHWDENARRLVLCRDKTGERTLFFHRGDGFVAFATSFNPLFTQADVPRELDDTVLTDQLTGISFERHRTIYRGIERVPAGAMAICDPAGVALRDYWAPQPRALGLKSREDYVEAARELLDVCVGAALRSERPVAATATGGLDSSGVAATAARLLAPDRLAVYTRVPPPGFERAETRQRVFNERSRVEALARLHPNMDVTFIDDGGLHELDQDPGRFYARTGVSSGAAPSVGWFAPLDERVVADGHRVLLIGQFGNLSLGWSGDHLIRQLFRAGRLGETARAIGAHRRATGQSLLKILRSHILAPLAPEAARYARRFWPGRGPGREFPGFVNPDFANDANLRQRVRELGAFQARAIRGETFAHRADWLMHTGQRARDWIAQRAEISGYEARDPLHDARMVEFCLNVPEAQYQWRGRPRALQRDVLADRTPPEIYDDFKHGVQLPEWYDRLGLQREAMLADVERIAHSPLATRVIDVARLRRALEDWPADESGLSEDRAIELNYGLTRTMHLARFICWFEGANQ